MADNFPSLGERKKERGRRGVRRLYFYSNEEIWKDSVAVSAERSLI